MKGVTRKERIINAMLEGDASACCGVSREERNLAKVAKATCDGQLGGGGSGGDEMVITINPYNETPVSANMTWDEFEAAYLKFGLNVYAVQTRASDNENLFHSYRVPCSVTVSDLGSDGMNTYALFQYIAATNQMSSTPKLVTVKWGKWDNTFTVTETDIAAT